ncbi:MAG: alpha-N-arabinofuranosidase [Lachnospiraceae bacterium]|nr:alpha-N-arabinofuranosidase [Lachnospiraceae bacterium]
MARLIINETKKLGTIAPEIYGHFSEHLGRCIYEGIYVGEDSDIPNVNGMRTDVVNALKEIDIPLLRWPGGCFADEYHWRDGIGNKNERKKMINTNWGGVVEDNSFGTHEFMELCRQLGCKTYINGNVGSGSVREMSEWIEYMTLDGTSPLSDLRKANGHEEPFRVDYFGVGNENWGCGGNMTPEYYGNEYRRYQTFIRQYDQDNPIMRICCGANSEDYYWTEDVMRTCYAHTTPEQHGFMDLLSLHYYTLPEGWLPKVSATEFDAGLWYKTLWAAHHIEQLIVRHGAIMDKYDPEKKVGMSVDEWGTWFEVEPGTNPGFLYQQNTMRDALVAGISLNIFNKHCDRVKLACIAQMVNVLQSVILTEGEKMIKTPTWHVMYMFRHHQGAELLDSSLTGVGTAGVKDDRMVPELTESVSVKDGVITITVNNLSFEEDRELEIQFADTGAREIVECLILKGDDARDKNTFDEPDKVAVKEYKGYRVDGGRIVLTVPCASVIELRVKG